MTRFTKDATHREIFNSVTWLWTLIQQGDEKARKYEKEIRRLYTDYADRDGIRRIAEEAELVEGGVHVHSFRRNQASA